MRKLSMHELERKNIKDFKAQEKRPIHLILDNIRSGHNVGAAFRTSDAFALKHMHLCGISPQPPHREILKSALGADQSVDWTAHEDAAEAIRNLKELGVKIFGVEQTDQTTLLQDLTWEGDEVALVFGNEVTGLSDEVLPLLDACLEVPQFGTKHSLNVSVCVGVVLWEFCRKGIPF